jgi:hypothetical protein
MESSAWTNERLDEFSCRIDQGLANVDQRFAQIDQRFQQLDRRSERLEDAINSVGEKTEHGFREVNRLMIRVGAGIIITLIGVIGTILATGG